MPSDRHTSTTVQPCLREQQFSLPESVDYLFDGVFLPCHPDHLVKDPISRSGARLASMGCLRGPGETIEVKRGWRKARFQVVWVGGDGTLQEHQSMTMTTNEHGCLVPLYTTAVQAGRHLPAARRYFR